MRFNHSRITGIGKRHLAIGDVLMLTGFACLKALTGSDYGISMLMRGLSHEAVRL